MDVTLALLADYANVSREGKLNVLGIFDRINAAELPHFHPQMYLVMRFEADPAEYGSQKAVEVRLLNADGRLLFGLTSDLTVPQAQGRPAVMQSLLALNGVIFEHPGDYAFVILVGGETKARVPLSVNLVSPQPEKEDS